MTALVDSVETVVCQQNRRTGNNDVPQNPANISVADECSKLILCLSKFKFKFSFYFFLIDFLV